MIHHLKIFITILLLTYTAGLKAQLVVDNNPPYNDPTYLVQNVMLNIGIFISNVEFNGSMLPPVGANADMIGYFTNSGGNMGIVEGVLFNTGSIYDAPGPNSSGSDGFDNFTGGDPDLDILAQAMSPGISTFNAAVLEFDFYTVTDGIDFRYVFASEEYNEYVCSIFNDVFGFIISGPGFTGPFSNGGVNIAVIPGSGGTYVAINSVNNGTVGMAGSPGGCGGLGDPGLNNTAYYIDNETPGGPIEYDGFTTILTAHADLVPCETYHIKIAVADAGDGVWDSGLFLEAASFGATGIQVEVGSIGTSSASISEGCDSVKVIFSRAGLTNDPLTINYQVQGSATNGTDYTALSGTIVVPVDSSSVSFYLSAILDGIAEGTESIVITIPANLTNSTCLDDVPSVATIFIVNTDPLSLIATNDTFVCSGVPVQLGTTVAGGFPGYSYSWSPSTGLSCVTCPNPTANPSVSTTYTVVVTDNCGSTPVTDDIQVNVGGLDLETTDNALLAVEGCQQGGFTFTRSGSATSPLTIYFTIGGSATNGVDYTMIADSVIIPAGQSSVEVVIFPIQDGNSEPNEDITIVTIPDTSGACPGAGLNAVLFIMNIDPISVWASNDTVICGGVSTSILAVGSGGMVGSLEYTWLDGADTVQVGTNGTLNIQPDVNTTYTVTVADTCGNPVATELVNVDVTIPPPSILAIQDTAYEGCRDALFMVYRSDTSTNEITIYYSITGSAANGIDYTAIYDSVIIPAGDTSAEINIYALVDGITEGDETLVIELPRDPNDVLCYVIPFKDSVIIKNIDPLTVDVLLETICPGESATLEADVAGGFGPITYSWSSGATTSSTTVNPTVTTLYTVTVEDTCGPPVIKLDATVEVRDVLGSIADGGVTAYEGCKNTEFIFTIPTELQSDFTINYTITGSATEGLDFVTVPTSITIPAGEDSAILEISTLLDQNTEGLESIVVTIIPASYDDTLFCVHTFEASVEIADVVPLEIEAFGDTSMCNFSVPLSSFASGGFGPLAFIWNNGAGSEQSTNVNPARTTTYIISVTDSCQSDTAEAEVTIEVDCEYLFFVPNAFTPNSDGLNDNFRAKWKGMKTFKMQIFNRWGDLIFTTRDRYEGWDGLGNEGEKLSEQEVYVYVIETTDFLDNEHTYVGKVSLIQ